DGDVAGGKALPGRAAIVVDTGVSESRAGEGERGNGRKEKGFHRDDLKSPGTAAREERGKVRGSGDQAEGGPRAPSGRGSYRAMTKAAGVPVSRMATGSGPRGRWQAGGRSAPAPIRQAWQGACSPLP